MTDLRVSDAEEVEAVHRAYYDAWERNDPDSMCSLWLDSDEILNVMPGDEPRRGRDRVLADVREAVGLTHGVQFLFTGVDVAVLGNVGMLSAVEICVTPQTFSFRALEEVDAVRLAVSTVYRRTPQGWRMVRHHVSPVISHLDLDGDLDGGSDGGSDAGSDGGADGWGRQGR